MARRNWMEDYLAGRPDEMHTEAPKASAENAAAGANPYPYGGSYWDNQYMTEDELRQIDSARQAAQRGEIPISQAHTLAESTRAKYGYSGGKDGSEYNLFDRPIRTDSIDNTISDVMARMANWDQIMGEDPYRAGIDQTYQAILNRKPFEYDLDTDPAWQAYRKQYTREGRRASEDVLGQYAAMTGGMPSTAAMTAASQAGDYYAAQMTDKIPELYKLAYSMYADDAQRQLADLNAIRGLSGDWYGRQQDAYGRLGDLYSMASGERSYADSRSDLAYERDRQAEQDAYNYAMATGDYSFLRDLGYDTSFLEKQRDKEMAELDKPELSLAEVNAAIKAGNTAPNVLKAWEYYYGAPYEGPTGAGYGGYYPTNQSSEKTTLADFAGKAPTERGLLGDFGKSDMRNRGVTDVTSGGSGAADVDQKTMEWRDYNRAGSGILEQLSRGNVAAAEEQADAIWDYLTPEQRENLRNTLALYGIEIEG